MNKVIAFLRLVTLNGDNYWYCGYVGVKNDSKIPHSIRADSNMINDYFNSLDVQISVYGGITFDGTWDETTPIIPVTDIPKDWYNYHCYGFDFNHCINDEIAMNFEYAKAEVLNMKEQMEKLIKHISPSTGN